MIDNCKIIFWYNCFYKSSNVFVLICLFYLIIADLKSFTLREFLTRENRWPQDCCDICWKFVR